MLRLALAACAAIGAALTLAPAAVPAVTGRSDRGGSCARPRHWNLDRAELARLHLALRRHGAMRHGPVRIEASDYGDSAHAGMSVTAARRWRVCKLHGTYADGSPWWLPGSVGGARERSVVYREFEDAPPASPRSLVVSYARRTSADGTTCADPQVVDFYAQGDRGAEVSYRPADANRARLVVQWRLARPSRFCYVKGLTWGHRPFTVLDAGDGSYETVGEYSSHTSSVAYLVVAFTR